MSEVQKARFLSPTAQNDQNSVCGEKKLISRVVQPPPLICCTFSAAERQQLKAPCSKATEEIPK